MTVVAWKVTFATLEKYRVATGEFVFVAVDEHGRPRQVKP